MSSRNIVQRSGNTLFYLHNVVSDWCVRCISLLMVTTHALLFALYNHLSFTPLELRFKFRGWIVIK